MFDSIFVVVLGVEILGDKCDLNRFIGKWSYSNDLYKNLADALIKRQQNWPQKALTNWPMDWLICQLCGLKHRPCKSTGHHPPPQKKKKTHTPHLVKTNKTNSKRSENACFFSFEDGLFSRFSDLEDDDLGKRLQETQCTRVVRFVEWWKYRYLHL